jgi:hypothetical protein
MFSTTSRASSQCFVPPPFASPGVVVEDRVRAVGRNVGGAADLQATPRLAGLLPRLELAGEHAGVGEQEWAGEVVPAGVAQEVAEVRSIPDGVSEHSLEGRAGGREGLDRFSVEGLQGDAVGGSVEDHLPVRARERGEHDVFSGRVDREELVEAPSRWPPLEPPDRAVDGDVGLDAGHGVPELLAACRSDGQVEELVSAMSDMAPESFNPVGYRARAATGYDTGHWQAVRECGRQLARLARLSSGLVRSRPRFVGVDVMGRGSAARVPRLSPARAHT